MRRRTTLNFIIRWNKNIAGVHEVVCFLGCSDYLKNQKRSKLDFYYSVYSLLLLVLSN